MASSALTKSRSAGSYGRRRAANACLICRARKTRCDNERPVCGFCASTGGLCQYPDADPSQFDRASLAIIQRLSELESRLVSHIDDSFKRQQTGSVRDIPSIPLCSTETPSQTSQATAAASNEHDVANGHEDRPPSSTAILLSSRMGLDDTLKSPVFAQSAPQLQEDLQTPTMKIWARSKPSLGSSVRSAGTMNLEPEWINQLVDNFLTHNHVKNPVLDVDLLRTYARDFAETGAQWDSKSCLMLLICAVSCVSAPLSQDLQPGLSKDQSRLDMAEAYFQASQRRIGMLYHQTSLIAAQCSFLTGVYLMSTMQILAAWKCFAQAGTQCLAWLISQGRIEGVGNMVDRKSDGTITYAEESLYWSCLKSELELRFELGLPGSAINEIQYPHVFPSPPININNDSNHQYSYDSPESNRSSSKAMTSRLDQQNTELGWFFYLAEIALKRIIHNVISWLHDFDSLSGGQGNRDHHLQAGAIEFETQVQDWYRALPPLMHFPIARDEATGNILRFILRGHMLDIREVIRLPCIYNVLSSDSVFINSDHSTTSNRLVRELLENAVERIKANREGWYHRHQGTWLMMRSATRSALHLMGMALKCHQAATVMNLNRQELEHEILPNDWREAVDLCVDLLDYWAGESVDIERLARILRALLHSYDDIEL